MVSFGPLIMPEMYARLDASDPKSAWDFAKFTPDVVVINLGENDSTLTKRPLSPQFKERFGAVPPTPEATVKAYADFYASIRARYPQAQIVCCLGCMDAVRSGSPWPGYIEQAVASLNDPRMTAHFFAFKGGPGHPNVAEQQAMADDLIAYLEKTAKW